MAEDFELDIFTRLRGLAWQDFLPRLRYLGYLDLRIPCLSPEDIIRCKHNSVREKDALDVIALKRIIQQQALRP